MLNKLIENIENHKITVRDWILSFTGIVFVRFLFESLSSPTPSGMMPSDPYTLIHYGLFFLTMTLGLICIVGYFTKNYISTSKFILFILPLTWIAPVFDVIASGGKGYIMTYIYNTPNGILLDFFKFITLKPIWGVTYGMTIYYVLLLLIIGFYVWSKRKNVLKVVSVLVLSYVFMFILGIMPSFLYAITHGFGDSTVQPISVMYYMNDLITKSNIFHNTLYETAVSVAPFRFLQLGFDKLISQILFIVSFMFGIFLFWKIEPQKIKAVIKNSRPERILLYLSFIVIGGYLAYSRDLGELSSWVDVAGILCLLLSWLGVWIYAVQINDIADVNIDKISNKERPLVQNTLTTGDMATIGNLALLTALLGSWNAGFYPFFMGLVGLAVSYIYSVPPLRLKRVPILSSFLISTVCLSACLAGFFFISFDKQIQSFPILISIGILIIFTLEINFRDMKDIEGDRAEGIPTLPTLFRENGPRVVGLCFALSFLLVPIFLSFYALYLLAIPGAFVGYKLITKKPYSEKPIFILHFAFLVSIVIFYLAV